MTTHDDTPISREEQLRRFGSWRPDGQVPEHLRNGGEETLNALRSAFGAGQVTKSATTAAAVRPLAIRLASVTAIAKAAGSSKLSTTETSGLKQALATLKGVLDGSLEPSALRQVSSLLTTIEAGVLGQPQPAPVPTDDGSQTAAALHAGLDELQGGAVAKSQAATDAGYRNLVALFGGGRPTPAAPKGAPTAKVSKALAIADVRTAAARLKRGPARPGMPAIIRSGGARPRA